MLTVTLIRAGTYGNLAVDWVSGYSADDIPINVTNGMINPSQASVSMVHGQEMANVTVQVIIIFKICTLWSVIFKKSFQLILSM